MFRPYFHNKSYVELRFMNNCIAVKFHLSLHMQEKVKVLYGHSKNGEMLYNTPNIHFSRIRDVYGDIPHSYFVDDDDIAIMSFRYFDNMHSMFMTELTPDDSELLHKINQIVTLLSKDQLSEYDFKETLKLIYHDKLQNVDDIFAILDEAEHE